MDYFLKSKEILEKTLPLNHPDLAVLYKNLENILKAKGSTEESMEYSIKLKHIFANTSDSTNDYDTINAFNLSNKSSEIGISAKIDIFTKKFKKFNIIDAQNEFNILCLLKPYKNYFLKPFSLQTTGKKIILQMEKGNCSLFRVKDEILKGNKILFTEREAKLIMQQILEAYSILKKERIVHSDVHPGNILIGHDNKIKLCDFEYSYKYTDVIEKNNEPFIMPKPYRFE